MGIWSRLRRTVREGRHSDEIQEELQFHLDMDAADGYDGRQTHLRLGNMTRISEETRAMGIVEWLESALQDARYGFRQLRKTPALTVAVVLSLTIGVGANTAIFSLVDAAILRPLPVEDPDSLVILEWTNEGFPPGIENHNGEYRPIEGGRHQGSSVAASLYRRLAREQTVFEPLMGIAAYPDPVAITVDGSPAEQVSIQYVSSNLFQGLGRPPVIGREFLEADDRVGQEPVVIVSHRFWLSRLAGSETALRRNIRINQVPARIVGVAPQGFFGIRAGQWPDVYAPLAAKVSFQPPSAGRGEDDRNWWVRQVGRMKPGVSAAAAKAQASGLFQNMIVPEGDKKIPQLVTLPGRRGLDALNARDTNALWILMLLVGMLMLIVCANVANLLLSRSVGRQRESSVRLALGAARSRLFRQHLIESSTFAILGGVAGAGLGYLLAQAIHVLFQTGRDASNAFDLHVNLRVLAFTGGLSAITALLFGLAPAVRASRSDVSGALKAQSRSVTGGRLRLPRFLVSVQVGLCLAALVAAGLLGRTLENLRWSEIGFDRENLAYATVNPARAGYRGERTGQYVDRVLEELSRLPGVSKVSTTQVRLLSGNGNWAGVSTAERPFRLPRGPSTGAEGAHMNAVGEGFFETMGIPLLAGRTLDRRDLQPDSGAVVVDELFAKRFFPNQNPLGRRFGIGLESTNRFEIVGVVGNSLYNRLRGHTVATFYQAYRGGGTTHFAMRSTLDSDRLAKALRKAVAAVDPAVPMTEFHTQTGLIDRMLRTERLLGFVSGAFAIVALALAAIGLGGLLAYAVARRTNEIGVRMALGAVSGDVIRMVLRDSMWMAGIGMLIGLPGAYAVGQLMKSMLFRLEPADPATTVLSLGALLGAALIAAWVPARRASRIDPLTALREE
jgi:predicted permease